MLAPRQIQLFRGDTLVWAVQVVQDPISGAYSTSLAPGVPPPGQVPANVTGWTFWFTAKRHYLDPDNQAVWQGGTASPLTGVVVTSPLSGRLTATMPPAQTIGFPDGSSTLVYDVQGKDGSGNIFTVEFGTIVVNPDATRATS